MAALAPDRDRIVFGSGSVTGKTLGKWRLIDKMGDGAYAYVYSAEPIDASNEPAKLAVGGYTSADTEALDSVVIPNTRRAIKVFKYKDADSFEQELKIHSYIANRLTGNGPIDEGKRHIVIAEDKTVHMEVLMGFKCKVYPCLIYPLYADSLSNIYDQLDDKGIPLSDAMRIGREILSGIRFLHKIGVVHGDIKLSNILTTQSFAQLKSPRDIRVAIADLGSSIMLEKGKTCKWESFGTQEYMAPEQLLELPLTHALDIWGFVVLMFELLTNSYIFNINDLLRKNNIDPESLDNADSQDEDKVNPILTKHHLALIIQLLGSIPMEMTKKSQYFNRKGQLKEISLQPRNLRKLIDDEYTVPPDTYDFLIRICERGLIVRPQDRPDVDAMMTLLFA
jgi:serine/threonine protein kinase